MKIFGIGMMKTGTSTLGYCLNYLGFRHRTFYPKLIRQISEQNFSQVWNVVDQYDSFEDNPWPMIYKKIDARYPESKFILTIRKDSEIWWESMTNHAKRMGPTAERKIIYGYAWPLGRKKEHIEQYEAHNSEVQTYFKNRPEKLLTICWEKGSGWSDLTEFLALPSVPDGTALPKTNSAVSQKINYSKWIRNTTKTFLISTLGYDPFMNRNFNA